MSISAAERARINHAPVTVVMGDQHTYTIAPLAPAALEALYRRYREFIGKSFGTLDFRGIVQMQNVVRLRLEEVYVPLRASTRSRGMEVISHIKPADTLIQRAGRITRAAATERKSVFFEAPPLDVGIDDGNLHSLVRDHPFLVVLGDPGAGKSTLVRMIMLVLAEGRGGADFGLRDEWLPIFFPVAAFAEVRGDPGSRDIAPLAYLRDYYCGREQPDYTPAKPGSCWSAAIAATAFCT